MPDQPAGPAPRQFGNVGIFLLREHRAAGGVGIGQLDEAELVARPQHDLLPEPGKVHGEQGQIKEGLGHEIPVGHGVQGVLESGCEAELGRYPVGVEGERRASQGAGAERRNVEAAPGGHQTVHVAGEGPTVGEQMVGQQHRLGPLEVRVAGEIDILGRRGPAPGGPAGDPGSDRRQPAAPAWRTAADRWRPDRCGFGRCGAGPPPRRRSR